MITFSGYLGDFIKSPADAVVDLYKQYVHDLGYVLDKHAPPTCKVP